jgi:hypothetical protein
MASLCGKGMKSLAKTDKKCVKFQTTFNKYQIKKMQKNDCNLPPRRK